MEVLWKQLGVGDAHGSRWKYLGVYLVQASTDIFVEAAIDGSNGKFIFHRQWKFPYISMEAPLTSTEENLLPPTSMEISTETSIDLHRIFQGIKFSSLESHLSCEVEDFVEKGRVGSCVRVSITRMMLRVFPDFVKDIPKSVDPYGSFVEAAGSW